MSGVTQIEQEYDAEGKRVRRTTPGGTLYLAADHLGSTRLVLDANGNCVNRSDFLPFGHELWRTDPCYLGNPAGAGPVTQRFTGQERDAETKLDFFGARYYSAGQGRFTSPDAPFADQSPADPLSWNLYSYVCRIRCQAVRRDKPAYGRG